MLSKRAALVGQTAHQLARQYVIETLMEGEERAALRTAVSALQTEVSTLRSELALAVEGPIMAAAKADAEERGLVRIAIMALHEEVSALRSDHALAVQALLSAAGKVDEKDAEKWVEESFKRK